MLHRPITRAGRECPGRSRSGLGGRHPLPGGSNAVGGRLVNAGRRWYLVAWDDVRADWRTFRVDRIRPYLPVGSPFVPRPISDEEVTALITRGVPPAARRYQARIVVHAPASTIAERIGPWVGTVEADGADRWILETGADSLELIAVYLGMLEADFTVSEPPELVAHLQSLAGRYPRATGR